MSQPIDHTEIDSRIWDDIVTFIDSGRVIPVVGQGVVTIGDNDQLLMPWLAAKLANELDVDTNGSELTINEIVCRFLRNGGHRHLIYNRLHQILQKENPQPGPTLERLASIKPFKLFVTATFDSLLEKAIRNSDPSAKVNVCSYSPKEGQKDTPARIEKILDRTIYHILGKSSPADNFVVWEDDMMEFILGLHTDLNRSVIKNLSQDLADTSFHYLTLGLNFSNWLVRFFLRATRQGSLIDPRRMDYLADKIDSGSHTDLVMYFSSLGNNIHILPCKPREFVKELSRRWQEHSPGDRKADSTVADFAHLLSSDKLDLKSETFFISYAREDQDAAFRIRDGLEAYGLSVWIDESELRTGTNYHHKLEDVIQEECGFFISVISENTETQTKAYFHQERTWAADRAGFFDEETRAQYYHPVLIDDTPRNQIRKEPRVFRRSQRVRLIDGEVSQDFAERLCELVIKKVQGQ